MKTKATKIKPVHSDEMTIEQQIKECELENKTLIKDLEMAREELDITREELEIAREELEQIKTSRSWNALTKWWNFRDALIPENSKRRVLFKVASTAICHPIWFASRVDIEHIFRFVDGVKNGGTESLLVRLGNYFGEGDIHVKRPSQIPVTEFESVESVPYLVVPTSDEPLVSIVIPVYNQFSYTYACLSSIARNSKGVDYEIIIADDCSNDLTKDLEKVIRGVSVIRNEENLRFLLNCNNAAKQAKGKYILFLNNDTQVMPGWLEPLVSLIESDDSVGMVGSKLIYPDGHLQEAGGIVWNDASAWNYGHLQNPADAEYNYVKEADYISGAAIMIKKRLWDEIGGFDERFVPAYYEDTDFAFAVRSKGYKVMYQPKSVVIHFEGISNGTDTNSGQKSYQIDNQKKFYDKWEKTLHEEQNKQGEDVFRAKDRSQRKKHILVVDHYVPHYDRDAGGRCTYMYLKLFVKMGLKVTFIGDNFARQEPYTTELNQMGIEVLYGRYYLSNWKKWFIENGNKFDYIYLQRPHVSIKYIDTIKKYSHAKVLYFAHDLHHIREKREYEITRDPKLLQSAEKWKEIEYKLFTDADVGHVVGSYEQEVIQKVFPYKPIRNIPLYLFEELPSDIEKDFGKRQDLLFVGGFNHRPNADAVLWFANEIFPLINKKYPDINWHIVGGHTTKEIEALAGDRIKVHGFVSDEELESLYRTCRVAVVPLRYGAGVKGKIIEAAYYQIPTVTTTIGAEGISAEEQALLIEDDAVKMASLICDIYEDQERLTQLSDNCADLIKNHYMIDEAERILALDIQP